MRFTHTTHSAPPRTKAFRRDPVAAVVRLPSEPCIYYPELIVHQTLMSGICAFMERLESFYMAWSEDAVTVRQPTKQIFQTAGIRGDWRVMPCAIAPCSPAADRLTHGINAVKVIGTNEEERLVQDKISVGKALLMHPTDHFVEAIFDVAALSSFRTAAISVLAYKFCGHRRNHIAAIVGAGRIGFYTAVILHQWLGVTTLLINDKQLARSDAFLKATAGWYGRGARTADLADLLNGSQAIFLATTSPQPVVTGRLSSRVRFISSVGADADNLSELALEATQGRLLVSESRQNMGVGDLRRWHAAGAYQPEDVAMLTSVMSAASRGDPITTPAVFISTGTAVQDALVCRFLHDRLNGRGGVALEALAPEDG